MSICKYCQIDYPSFDLSKEGFNLVVNDLRNGSKTLAVVDVKHMVNCGQEEAQSWFDHLTCCPGSWPYSEQDQQIPAVIDAAFANIAKPEHFTNYTHCDECEEHDDTLRNHTRENISRDALGNGGWDPMTFSSDDGIGYYFPALARYALQPDIWPKRDWYGSQLIFHLSYQGGNNRFLAWCSTKQQDAVFALLKHIAETRQQDVKIYGDEEDLNIAIKNWGGLDA